MGAWWWPGGCSDRLLPNGCLRAEGGKGCVSRTLISPHACLVITKGRINERVTQGARHLNPAPHQRFCLGPGHRKGAGTQREEGE